MTDADALFQAILAAPADDLPRLVYADWLDDTGTDPPRAEFIRLACGPQTPAAVARADELLAAHRPRWETPGLPRPTHQMFRRGFVGGVRTTADRFLAAADHIGRMPGLTELQLSNAADRLAELATVSWLPRVESLNLTNSVGLTKGIDRLLDLPLPNLRSLELRNCQIWPGDMKALADIADRFPLLERLNLSGNPLGNDGLAHLVERRFPRLTEVAIRCDELQFIDAIHPSAMDVLAESELLGGLTRLDLAGHHLGDGGLTALAASPRAARLEWLDVSGNRIGQEPGAGIEAVVAAAALGRLRVLRIGRSHVTRDAAVALAGWGRLAGMDEVNLTGCEFLPGARELLGGHPFVTDDDSRDARRSHDSED